MRVMGGIAADMKREPTLGVPKSPYRRGGRLFGPS